MQGAELGRRKLCVCCSGALCKLEAFCREKRGSIKGGNVENVEKNAAKEQQEISTDSCARRCGRAR